MANVRRLAFDTLYRVLYEDAYSAIAINHCVKDNELNQLDSSFLSALVYGVLERKLTLEYIIRKHSSIRIKKIENKTLIVLYLGVYQLVYMDKVPDNAAVDESVKLCKKLRLFKSAGFVNAVLRGIVRADKSIELPDEKDTVRYLSVKYSCPEDIVDLWLTQYGREKTEMILGGLIGRPPITVRVNTLKTTKEALMADLTARGIKAEPVGFLDNALELSNTGSLESIPQFREGHFFVEDAASQLCAQILGAREGETVCDVCSAPGGKAFSTAIHMGDKGRVYAYDIHANKLRLIEDGASRLGMTSIICKQRDASDSANKLPECDRILCDVPCSGLGILRRKPEIRYKSNKTLDILPDLQYSILCISADMATNGCTLVYSTCTLNDSENIGNIKRFLEEHPDFEGAEIELPDGIDRVIDEPAYCLTLLPGMYNTDGFFIAKLRRVSHEN